MIVAVPNVVLKICIILHVSPGVVVRCGEPIDPVLFILLRYLSVFINGISQPVGSRFLNSAAFLCSFSLNAAVSSEGELYAKKH